MTLKYDGQLEIDQERGVIYFHSKSGATLLRIASLPKKNPHTFDSEICWQEFCQMAARNNIA